MARAVMTYRSLMKEAKLRKVDTNPLFKAAAKTYDSQAKRKAKLEEQLEADGATVTKTYVKGRDNVTAHPLLDILQKLEDSMNRTLQTMKDIMVAMGQEKEEQDDDLSAFRQI